VISLRTELERSEEIHRLKRMQVSIARQYARAIGSSADYAVEIEPRSVAEFRRHLLALQAKVQSAAAVDDFERIQSSFRGELREYRDHCVESLARMRGEMAAAVMALHSVTERVTSSETDLKAQINGEIQHLEEAADVSDLPTIQSVIHEAVAGLRAGYEQLERSNHLMVAQLQDELRSLHKEIAGERRAFFTDRASGAWNRQKLDPRIAELLERRDPFWIVFIRFAWKPVETPLDIALLNGTLHAVVGRLESLLETDAMIGRWQEDVFAAIIEWEPAAECEICAAIKAKASYPYAIQVDGVSHTVNLRVSVGPAAFTRETGGGDFYLRIGQVVESLGSQL
jgi:GGDEF domain-containing protein